MEYRRSERTADRLKPRGTDSAKSFGETAHAPDSETTQARYSAFLTKDRTCLKHSFLGSAIEKRGGDFVIGQWVLKSSRI